MKTIQAIVELAQEAPAGEMLAMATVMTVRGSAYRRPGARMLMTTDGRTAGMISGGCLENDARERARVVMASEKPCMVTYDTTSPADIVFGLGLGCNGIVKVLIEPLRVQDESGLLAFLSSCVARRQSGRVATVFQSDRFPVGARLLRWPDGRVTSTCHDSAMSAALQRAFHEMGARRTVVRWIDLPDGSSTGVLLEAVAPPVPLTIFGAGDDAIPLARLAKLVGWHVTVVDARPAFTRPERFPMADAVHCLHPAELASSPEVVFPPESIVMIMTHHFGHDKALLSELLPRGLRYLGALGPKLRTQRLLDELAEDGITFSDDALARLHGPAGLDIGAETPEEIAVSILSEMQAVLANRDGGALSERAGPIHDPAETNLRTT